MWIERCESGELAESDLAQLRELWADAFGDQFTREDEEHALGGIHVIARDQTGVLAQASVVPRRIRFGSRWQPVGYVEGVATRRSRQRTGIGRTVMQVLQQDLDLRWTVGVLSTGSAQSFYEQLGWVRWQGPSFVISATLERRTPDEDAGLMVRTRPGSTYLDLTQSISCEDRPGDDW